MKKTTRMLCLLIALLMVGTLVLAACEQHVCGHVCPLCHKCLDLECEDEVCAEKCQGHTETYIDILDYRAYMKAELKAAKDLIGSVSTDVDAAVTSAYNAGLAEIEAKYTITDIRDAYSAAKTAMANCVPLASGIFDNASASYDRRAEILGVLENYGVRTGITGVTLYENGSNVMYSDRVVLGTENYIPNYGFGLLAEGNLTKKLETEANADWQMYLHSVLSEDPGSACYQDSNESLTSDIYSYISNSFYGTFMNETKDGYIWVPELAAADPEPVGELDAKGTTAKWRIELRKGLKYNTLSKLADRAAFNGREVALEDYITGYKLLMNAGNEYYRGSEEAGKGSDNSSIKGLAAYHEASKALNKKGILTDAELSFTSTTSIRTYEENGKWYFEFEFVGPQTAYNARYYCNSSLTMPIPKDFIDLVGVDEYLNFSSDSKRTPVDNSLSLGGYTLEQWDSQQQIVYKKNPFYAHADTKYQIAGVHINILTALLQDPEAGFNEFLANKIDSSGIPNSRLEQYINDPRTRKTSGDTCLKLNFNALSQSQWEVFFGTDGTILPTEADQYWNCKPAMANAHFRAALSYALNRDDLCAKKGYVSSVNYFSSAYMANPEEGIAYDLTDAHEKAVAGLLEDTVNGYSLELARDYFRMALAELEAEGAYTPGTAENPTVITIEVMWWNEAMRESLHKYIEQYWEDAFNDNSVHGGKYQLDIVFTIGGATTDDAYNRLQAGQFDIGFGAIEGAVLNPLTIMGTVSTDPIIAQGFTLNWSLDTNDPAAELLVFDGMRWSFDALWSTTKATTPIENGTFDRELSTFTLTVKEGSLNQTADSTTVTLNVSWLAAVTDVAFSDLVIYGYDADENYSEASIKSCIVGDVKLDATARTLEITVTIPKAMYENYSAKLAGYQGIDLYLDYKIESLEKDVTEDYVDGWSIPFVK